MSKTLSLKKLDVSLPLGPATLVEHDSAPAAEVKAYTADELRAMLAAMGESEKPARVITDKTMDLSIDDLPAHEIADKTGLDSDIYARASTLVQVPPQVHGKFGLNGIPLIAPGVDLSQNVNPATGQPYAQVGVRQVTQIQVAPQNFSRRRG